MSNCRLCGQACKLIKAHVIPEAFFRDARGATPELLLVSGAGDHLPKMARIGAYDKTILCASCEARFSEIDTYGAQALTVAALDDKFSPLVRDGRVFGFESQTLDPRKLLRFLVSVLWRASVSSQPFYRAVDLGPLEQDAVRFALDGVEDKPLFDAVLSRWARTANGPEPKTVILDPVPERWAGGVRGYRLYLGQAVAYVKVDARPFSDPGFRELGLAQSQNVLMATRDQATSTDFRAVRRTVLRSSLHERAFKSARARRSSSG